jgi:hypothetical protein
MSARITLQRGDALPHFQIATIDGEQFSYATIWQRKHLVLVVLGGPDADNSYASAVSARAAEFRDRETECVMTRDDVCGLHSPGVLIADRWGEVVHIAQTSGSARLLSPDEVIEWLDYLRQRCPECEGEAH